MIAKLGQKIIMNAFLQSYYRNVMC